MTRLTQSQVRDRISLDLKACLPNGFNIQYPDVSGFTIPVDTAWARVTVKFVGRSARGMGDQKKKYVGYGVACIQLFTPQGDGLTQNDSLSDTAVLTLESTVSSPITYRNIRAVDVGPDGAFTQTNIYADFEYEDHH